MGPTMRELCPESGLREDLPEIAGPQWYALHVRYRHELRVGHLLESRGWNTLAPVYRSSRQWSDRRKEIELPLFSGYVFCRFPSEESRYVEDTPGVARIVRFNSRPAPIPAPEIASIQTMIAAGVSLSPWPFLKAGDRVRVERGPLRGLEGTLLRDGESSRLVISVGLLQRSIAAEVEPGMVTPIRGRAATGGA